MSDNKVNIILGMEGAGALRTLQDVEGALGKVLGVLSSIGVSVGLAALTNSLVDTASAFEKLETRLTTIQGSSAAARQSMAWITNFTAKTPYELNQVADAFVKLNAYGFDAVRWMPMLGDTASSMGKDLNDAVEMFADATTGEFERLKEFGVRAKQQGDTVSFSWVENGRQMQLSTEKTQAGISEAIGQVFRRFDGGMKAQAANWEGMTSNMADVWTAFRLDIMSEGVFEELKRGLAEVLETATRLKDDGTLREWANGITDAIFRAEAEAIRLAMLLDKIGGTMTMIPMGIFAPGAALGNDNSIEQFNTWAQRNLDLKKRYEDGDKALQELANRQFAAQNQGTATAPPATVSNTTAGGAQKPNAEADKKAAKETTDAWKKAFTDLKFESADYYAYRVKQIDAETVEMRKAGVSAITAEQWRNNELKQLDEERAKYEGDLDAKRIEAIKAVNQLRLKLHQEADEAEKKELATLASINDYILQATDPQAAAIARVTAEYDRQVQAVMELHDTTTGMSDDEALAKIDALDRAHAANLREVTTSHEKAVTTIDRTWDKGFDRLQDLTGDWLRNQRVSMASVGDMMGNLVLEMVNTWAWGQAQMVFTGGQAGGFSGGNILSTVASLASPGMQGNVGTIAGIYTVGKELLTPGSYAAGLTSLQNGASGLTGLFGGTGGGTASASMLAENFGAGAPGVNGTIQGLSSAALSGWTAGISTFGLDLLNGKDFGYSAGHGASAGGGAYLGAELGTLILPGVGTVLGAILGSLGGGKLFESIVGGGDDPWVRRWYTDLSASRALDGVALNTPADDPMAPLFDQANLAISTYLKQVPLNLRSSVMDAFTEAFGTKSWNSGKEDSYQDIAAELANWLTTTITTDLATATKTALLAAVESSRTKDWSLLDPANAIDLVRLINGEARAMNGGGIVYTGPYLQGLAEQGDVAGVYQMANQYVAAMDQLLNIIDPTRVNSAARALTQIAIQFGAMRDQADGLGIALDLVDQAQEAAIQGLIDRYRQPAAEVVAAHSGTDLSRGLQLISDWQEQQLKQAEELKERMTADDYTSWLADIVDATKYKIQDLVDALIKSWDEFANALTVGEQSAANPMQRYQLLGAQLSGLGQAALGGDQDAAAAFQTAAGNYLDLSRELNTSALAYAADSGWILGWVNRIKQSVQVETTTVPSTTATTGLARSRSDQASGQEIADLRQELIDMKSVMTAVVTQTQATSQILRRWDLGVPSVQDDTTLWLFSSPNN